MPDLVAVTGASGHVGANLVRALRAQGRTVRVLAHDDRSGFEGQGVDEVRGDVRDAHAVQRLVDGARTVFHCAAKISIVGDRDGSVWSINVDGTRTVGTAARDAGARMVHVSSCHAFDLRGDRVDGTGPRPGPDHPAYDRSKAAGEAALVQIAGLDCVVLNPAGVLGPHDYRPSRMGQLFLDLKRRRLPAVVDGGFSWLDVRDLVDAAIAAEARGQGGVNYLLGGHYRSIRRLVDLAAEVCGVRPPRVASPQWLARLGAPFLTAWARATGAEPLYTAEALFTLRTPDNFDCSAAERDLSFRPRPLRATVEAVYADFDRRGL